MSTSDRRTGRMLIEIFKEQSERLFGFFVRGAGGGAEDLLQETFLRAWDQRESLHGGTEEGARESARRFVWRVAGSLLIDEFRMKRRRGEQPPRRGAARPGAPGHAGEIEMADAARTVRETVAMLPDARARRCLVLWLDGLDVGEIANEVALGVDQARGLLQRGRREVIRRASHRLSLALSGTPHRAGDSV